MINGLIDLSIRHRVWVLMLTVALILAGWFSIKQTPVDAIPDLSDVQVIIKTAYPGQAPKVVQDQVTYPLSTAMLSVPKAVTVRGFSFFGDSYLYIIFEDDTDMYWARSRVLEYLSQVSSRLPDGVQPELGPDATGVGWVFNYALVDKTGNHDLSELRSIQDWFLKFELQTVPGVSEVATVGGMVRQYQVEIDPLKLRAYGIPLDHVNTAIRQGNQERGASVLEMAEAEYMVRIHGYLESIEDIKNIPLGVNTKGTSLLLGDVARVSVGPQMRRGIAELNGEGEVVGGIVVMRYGENAQATIEKVKQKLNQLKASLPQGVELVVTYDRSELIQNAIDNLMSKLLEEFVVVSLICMLFLFHFRSSLVVLISLPMAILCAYIIMYLQGVSANIMSLGGIAIAIGAMVDGAIVMIENVHKHFSRQTVTTENRWQIIAKASKEVGPALFFSLLIITLSFLPVFTLEAQEGRLFTPLALTKTYAMAMAAALAITLVPVLMGYFIRGHIRDEKDNPLHQFFLKLYLPVLRTCLSFPKTVVALAVVLLVSTWYPLSNTGSEFMPPLDEGDLMYMPTTYAGVSIGKARQILQQTDKLIKTIPEVKTVFGKVGRAETATDPAPLTMIETVIQFKPKSQWRAGVTSESLQKELNQLIDFPGLTNAFVMPIKTRIDMLATGIKTPVGIKVSGPDLGIIEELGEKLEGILSVLPGTLSVYSERVVGGRYINIKIDRGKAARYGLNIEALQNTAQAAIGGVNVTQTVEGLERYPINVRYAQHYRDHVEKLKSLPILTETQNYIPLSAVADISIDEGAAMIKSENARLNGWTYIDIQGRDLSGYVKQAQQAVSEQLDLPSGYALNWTGQYEYLLRAQEKFSIVMPITLFVIAVLLYLSLKRIQDVALILLTMPFSLIGGIGLIYLLDYQYSVAVGVGFIALAGVSVEIGILMMLYLNHAWQDFQQANDQDKNKITMTGLKQVVEQGASARLRPILMTSLSSIVGLMPIMFTSGTGSEVMQRIAAPMIGGMVSTLILSLLLLPVLFYLIKRFKSKRSL
ncbi:CusA/CzcA family heavy metal efflux RND transporter [Oceaniserpentilla sp. 4NH20-0058]|uniref:efflux RND transporter permease subunit n=1 Tax=Oceaniserpentilla sp. 4NH20-0058 TaxID=3127660 RepID=UPI00333F7F2B